MEFSLSLTTDQESTIWPFSWLGWTQVERRISAGQFLNQLFIIGVDLHPYDAVLLRRWRFLERECSVPSEALRSVINVTNIVDTYSQWGTYAAIFRSTGFTYCRIYVNIYIPPYICVDTSVEYKIFIPVYMHAFLIQRWVNVYHGDLVNQEIENGDSLHQFSELFPRGNLYTYVYDFFSVGQILA